VNRIALARSALSTVLCAVLVVPTFAQFPDEPALPPIPQPPLRDIPTDPDAPPSSELPRLAEACAAITDLVNLRTGPGDTYPIVTALPPGTVVLLLEEATQQWQHVATTAGGGWIFKAYIQPATCPPPRPLAEDVPPSEVPVPIPVSVPVVPPPPAAVYGAPLLARPMASL
jgi:hypothetical protein